MYCFLNVSYITVVIMHKYIKTLLLLTMSVNMAFCVQVHHHGNCLLTTPYFFYPYCWILQGGCDDMLLFNICTHNNCT